MHLIPMPKKLEVYDRPVRYSGIQPFDKDIDARIKNAVLKLPCDENGAILNITLGESDSEAYSLNLGEYEISISADGIRGVFYGLQTLRQIFMNSQVHQLYIEDEPDFSYRGFYHDITRGKVPTLETLKKLVDNMALYKMNSLQLYVEHTFEFDEYKDSIERTGYITAEEIRELDVYCSENFVEFIPSVATFGHLYELLQKDEYKDLCVIKDFHPTTHYWHNRMKHHTIDPLNPKSIEVVKSIISQYSVLFSSDKFNICCDETFDLVNYKKGEVDSGKLYVEFVKKIIDVVKSQDKQIMMWADILLEHPECIDDIPEDVYLLNWHYWRNPPEERVEQISKTGRKQIVCPGTSTWNRLCEDTEMERINISKMVQYGYNHGAVGVLNTNWGDYGNLCCLELAMYGLILGAEKSWNVKTEFDEKFNKSAGRILYGADDGVKWLDLLSRMHENIHWSMLVGRYSNYHFEEKLEDELDGADSIAEVQRLYKLFSEELSKEIWLNDEYRREMLISAEGICVMAELMAKERGIDVPRLTDTKQWLNKYRMMWISKNKESELSEIEKVFMFFEKK